MLATISIPCSENLLSWLCETHNFAELCNPVQSSLMLSQDHILGRNAACYKRTNTLSRTILRHQKCGEAELVSATLVPYGC